MIKKIVDDSKTTPRPEDYALLLGRRYTRLWQLLDELRLQRALVESYKAATEEECNRDVLSFYNEELKKYQALCDEVHKAKVEIECIERTSGQKCADSPI